MNKQAEQKGKWRALLVVCSLVFFSISFPYLYLNWHYLPYFYKGYDKSFNSERTRIGQPIIEDYFVPKFRNSKRRQIWYAPDSLKFQRIHTGKFYGTERGKITFESDSYRKKIDSVNSLRLSREYYYPSDSIAYYLETLQNGRKVTTDTLSKIKGDSVLSAWMK